MTPFDHAKKIQLASAKLHRRLRKVNEASADLCSALSEAASAACNTGLLTASEAEEVIAPKDEE